jgi:hypothetical protein
VCAPASPYRRTPSIRYRHRALIEPRSHTEQSNSVVSANCPQPKDCRPAQCRCRSTVIVEARPRTNGTPVRLTSTALNCVTGWTAVPSTPSSANRAFVGCAVSALHRPTGRAVIPSPSVTVAVVRWWVSIAVVRRPRVIILRLGRHECAKRDCANAARGQKYSRCTHRVALIFLFRPTLSLALMAPAIRGNLRTTVRLASAPSHHSGEQRTNALTWLFQWSLAPR